MWDRKIREYASDSKGEKLNKRNHVQQNQQIGIIEFNNFDDLVSGNFKRDMTPLLSPRTRVKPNNIVNPSPEGKASKPDNIIVVNPSVVQRPSDGKFLLYFKGNFYNPHYRGVHGLATSDLPNGPFIETDNFVFDFTDSEGKIASAEDPYVWYHPKYKKFYSLLKDFSGLLTEGKPGLALLESIDGFKWTKPPNLFFMKKELILSSGDTIKVVRLERPQLLIDENGNLTVFYAVCSIGDINPRLDGASFNVHVPLETDY